MFSDLDGWIRMRLRSKVRGSKARACSNARLPNRVLRDFGLVSWERLARAKRLSPVKG